MFFSNTHWPQLIIPFYSILFETSICQFNSSEFSPIMPDEVREHLTRDQRPFLHPEPLQILQIHPEPLQIHPESLQILQIHPEPLQILQIHSFFSSVHLTHVLQGSGQRTGMASRSLVLCSVTHFCVVFEVCVWIIVRLEDPNTAHYKISNRVSHLLILYLLVFDRIHDAMCLDKMSRTSSRNIGPQH